MDKTRNSILKFLNLTNDKFKIPKHLLIRLKTLKNSEIV